MAIGYGSLDYEKYQNLIENSCLRIEQLSSALLISNRPSMSSALNETAPKSIAIIQKIVEIIINEKKLIWPKNVQLIFVEMTDSAILQSRKSKYDPIKLGRIISNLLDNAYDSLPVNGVIEIKILIEDEHNIISVRDYGSGIPANLVLQLGQERVTSKKNGNGLGLFLAINHLKEWDAVLKIQSRPGETLIKICIPNT